MKAQCSHIEEPLGRRFTHLGKAFLDILHEKLGHLDIERNFYTLLLIDEGQGQLTQQDLCLIMKTDKVTVLRIVDYLSENGYLTKSKDEADKRKLNLVLTPKALKEIPDIRRSLEEVTELAFSGISKYEKAGFYSTLEKIKTNISTYNSTRQR